MPLPRLRQACAALVVSLSLTAAGAAAPNPADAAPSQAAPPLAERGALLIDGAPVHYRTNGQDVRAPRPVVFVFAGTAELGMQETFGGLAAALVRDGWLHLTMDFPLGGGLFDWAAMVNDEIDFVAPFVARFDRVVTHLVEQGIADAKQITVAGYSRGGFMALHAATNPKVAAAAVIMPVTDLRRLTEFENLSRSALAARLSAERLAPRLRHTKVWGTIASDDPRVGTAAYLRFADAMRAAGNPMTSIVYPGQAHAVPRARTQAAVAAWLRSQRRP